MVHSHKLRNNVAGESQLHGKEIFQYTNFKKKIQKVIKIVKYVFRIRYGCAQSTARIPNDRCLPGRSV